MPYSNPSEQSEQSTRLAEEVAYRLLEGPGRLFAIVDAACNEQILSLVHKLDIQAQCLYTGDGAIRLAAYAHPYLLSFKDTLHPLSRYLVYSWSHQWGIFLRSESSAEAIFSHLADFITVMLPDDREAYFRFYDPRVLPGFLSSSTPDTLAKFFGTAIDCFLVEDGSGNTLIQYRITPPGKTHDKHRLSTATFSIQRFGESPGSGCETGHPSPSFILCSGDYP